MPRALIVGCEGQDGTLLAEFLCPRGYTVDGVVRYGKQPGPAEGFHSIDIENPEFVPQHFRLVMAKGASVRECEVAWIRQKRIGVAFVATPQESSDPGEGG